VTLASPKLEPTLPFAAGPLSSTVLGLLACRPPQRSFTPVALPISEADPYGLDLHLALYICYELHYRGFDGVDARWEWNPVLLAVRGQLEDAFLDAVRRDVGKIDTDDQAAAEMDALCVEPVDGNGPSYHLRDNGTWEQMQEYFVHRSLYHLKEGDPHAFAIPRLTGQAKASFVAIEYDEFGGGQGSQVHQQLFADLMDAAGLDSSYLAYLEAVPAESLAVVNLMSMFGLHRELRGAAIGDFASTEITSSPGSRRIVDALRRLGAPDACVRFYAEHIEADAVHEQIIRHGVIGPLLAAEPHLADDVVFGIRGSGFLGERFGDQLLDAWEQGRPTLRTPLPDAPALAGSTR